MFTPLMRHKCHVSGDRCQVSGVKNKIVIKGLSQHVMGLLSTTPTPSSVSKNTYILAWFCMTFVKYKLSSESLQYSIKQGDPGGNGSSFQRMAPFPSYTRLAGEMTHSIQMQRQSATNISQGFMKTNLMKQIIYNQQMIATEKSESVIP